MNKINWKQKLTSRKFWIAIVGIIVGIAAAFGIRDNDYAQIAGVITSIASAISYVVGEAIVDKSRLEANKDTTTEKTNDDTTTDVSEDVGKE